MTTYTRTYARTNACTYTCTYTCEYADPVPSPNYINPSFLPTPTRNPEPEIGPNQVHWSHPDRRWESWCGAPIIGVETTTDVTCRTCQRLKEGRKDS